MTGGVAIMQIGSLDSFGDSVKAAAAPQTAAAAVGVADADEQSGTEITDVGASYQSDTLKNSSEQSKDQKAKENSVSEFDNTALNFKVHEGTGEIMIQIIDNTTGKVVREIPPESILDSIAEIWKISGINVNKKV
jgi:flagellar protein FlaG